MSERPTGLDDPEYAAFAWRRYRRLLGWMTLWSLLCGIVAVLDWPVEKIMTAPAISVAPTADILGALSLMTRRRIRHLPVVEGEALVGLVSIGDLVKFRMDRIEAEAEAMLNYIQSV